MSNMRLQLMLDFIYKKGKAAQAKRDILDLKRATKGIGKDTGHKDMARDMERLGHSAYRARREYVMLAREARKARNGMAAGFNSGVPKAGSGKGGGVLMGTRGMLRAGVSIYAVKKGFDLTVGSAISFEKAMADVKKKVDLPVGQTWGDLESTIVRNAIAFGRSREEVAALVAEAGAAGIAYEDLTAYTKLATKAAIGWDMTADQTAQKLAEIKAATGWTIPQLEDFADKVNMLGDTSAAKESDILEMFQRAGSAAEAAGVSFDVTLASLTALRSIGMREEVASRFFNAFASNLRIATHLPKKASEGFKMLGLNAKKVEKGMKTDALGTMVDVLERLDKNPDKAAAAIKIFGQQWWDEAARMGRAIPEMIKNIKGLSNEANWKGSLENNLNVELSTTANHLERLKALSAEVGDRMGKWALPGLNEQINGLVSLMDKLDKGDTWWQRQMKFYEERDKAYREANGLPELGTYDPQAEQKKIDDYINENNLHWTQPFSPNSWKHWFGSGSGGAQTGEEAGQQGRAEGIKKAREEQEKKYWEWKSADQHRDDLKREVAEGGIFTYFKQAQLNRLHELDKGIVPILQSRIRDNDQQLANVRRKPAFDINGPVIPKNVPMTIGPGGVFDLGLGGEGPIASLPGLKSAAASSNYTLPQTAAAGASGVVQGQLGADMSGAGQQAMQSYANGIKAGGAQAVAAANAVVSQVNSVLSTAGAGVGAGAGSRLSGALHDGVTGG